MGLNVTKLKITNFLLQTVVIAFIRMNITPMPLDGISRGKRLPAIRTGVDKVSLEVDRLHVVLYVGPGLVDKVGAEAASVSLGVGRVARHEL